MVTNLDEIRQAATEKIKNKLPMPYVLLVQHGAWICSYDETTKEIADGIIEPLNEQAKELGTTRRLRREYTVPVVVRRESRPVAIVCKEEPAATPWWLDH